MRALIVGAGSVGKRHLANFQSFGVEGLGAVDLREDRRREVSERFPSVRVYDELDVALQGGYDAVVVCTPTAYHTDVARRSLGAGAHVLMEKPISNRLEGVEETLTLANERALICMVGYTYRFWPPLQRLHELITQGVIGRVLFADITFSQYLPDWHPWEDYREWFMSRREEGGGALLDESHAIDLARWLFGEVVEVFCRTGNLSSLEMTADDFAQFVVVFDTGMVATIHLDVFGRQARRTIDVSGERGSLRIDVTEGEIDIFDAESRAQRTIGFQCDRNEMFVAEARHFLGCIREGLTPCVSGQDALRTLRVCLAGQESSSTNCVVRLQ
jgi:predicted dehydrogenase